MKVLISGGTGQLGRALVAALTGAEHRVRVLSRRAGPERPGVTRVVGDLRSPASLRSATEGVRAVIHAASDPTDSKEVDVRGTRNLVEAARATGVEHVVYVSIVGIDRIPLPYYRDKLEAERIVESADVPYTILRASQFHGFVDFLLRRAYRFRPFLPVPSGVRVQSVDVREVAARLARTVDSPPARRLPDLFGPQLLRASDAARIWARAQRLPHLVVPLPVVGSVVRGLRAGHNVAPERPGGGPTWAEWVRARYGSG